MADKKMSKRLYLRRIMSNSGRGDISQLSPEDLKKTIISLQNGKTFGRGESNEVILSVEQSNNINPLISRFHAKILHQNTSNDETYLVLDTSENGTYVNDRRLKKSEPRKLKSGDTIKFGHRNGGSIKPGEEGLQTDAIFVFSVEVPQDDETSRLLEQHKDTKLKVFSGNPVAELIADPSSSSSSKKVQQEEADSTNGNSEYAMNASSSKQDQHFPSTSHGLDFEMPEESKRMKKHSDISYRSLTSFLYHNTKEGPYKTLLTDMIFRIESRHPKLSLYTVQTLVALSVIEHPDTKEEIIERINHLAIYLIEKIPEDKSSGELLLITSDKVADSVLAEKETIEAIVKLSGVLGKRENNGRAGLERTRAIGKTLWNLASNFKPSPSSAFQPPQSTSQKTNDSVVFAPVAIRVEPRFGECYTHMTTNLNATPEVAIEHLKDLDRSSRAMLEISSAIYAASSTPKKAHEVPVIACLSGAGTPSLMDCQPSSSAVHNESSPEADEDRHSSSITSGADIRRRTESERTESSEIVDVVGFSDSVVEKQPKRVAPVEKLSVITPVALETELNGGTQTPSPVLPDSEEANRKKDATTRKNFEAASKALRNTSTPHGDDQAGPSSISTAPTPVQSPLPGIIASTSENTSMSSATQSKESIDEPREEDKMEDDSPNVTPEKKKEEEVKVVQKKAAEEKEKQSAANPKAEVAPKNNGRRSMKQLDESGDSDSDDDEKSTQKKKKTVRRSTRTVKAGSPKKVPKKDADGEEGDDDEEEVAETPKRKGRTPKALKRSAAKATDKDRNAKSPAPEDEAEETVPKKRGRKKAESTETSTSAKETCGGQPAKWCCLTKNTHKFEPFWVECSDCNQWYHSFCIKFDNVEFGQDEYFSCCLDPSNEFKNAKNGVVHKKFLESQKDARRSGKGSRKNAHRDT